MTLMIQLDAEFIDGRRCQAAEGTAESEKVQYFMGLFAISSFSVANVHCNLDLFVNQA